MGRTSREKGARGEREFAALCRAHGYPEAVRTAQHAGKNGGQPDVVGLPGVHIEVKRTEALRLYDAVDQAKRDAPAGRLRAVAHRKNNADWLIVMPADDWFEIYREWEAGKYISESPETEERRVRAYKAVVGVSEPGGSKVSADYEKPPHGACTRLSDVLTTMDDSFKKFLKRNGLHVVEDEPIPAEDEPTLTDGSLARELAAERAMEARFGIDVPRCKICNGRLKNGALSAICPYCGSRAGEGAGE